MHIQNSEILVDTLPSCCSFVYRLVLQMYQVKIEVGVLVDEDASMATSVEAAVGWETELGTEILLSCCGVR